MAKLISLANLTKYDELIKSYIGTEDAKSFKAAEIDGRVIKLYKTTGKTDSPVEITLPAEVDITGKADKVADAVNGNFAGLDADGNLTDSGKKAADFASASDMTTAKANIETLMGGEAVEGSVAKTVKDAIDELDGVVTGEGSFVKSISQADGVVTATLGGISVDEVPTLTLAKISDAGTAAAKDVATTAIAEKTESTDLVTAAQVAKFVADEVADLEGATHFIGKKDALPATAKDGDIVIVGVKEYIWSNGAWEELGDETIYVTKTTTIAGVDLENDITKEEMLTALGVADGAQVNVLEGVQVNGADLTITDKKVNVTVAEGTVDGTIAVNGSNVAVHGLGSAAYTDADAYATAAQGAKADSAVQSVVASTTTDGVIVVDGAEVAVKGVWTDTNYSVAIEKDITDLFK